MLGYHTARIYIYKDFIYILTVYVFVFNIECSFYYYSLKTIRTTV